MRAASLVFVVRRIGNSLALLPFYPFKRFGVTRSLYCDKDQRYHPKGFMS
jgi:hypothetical protein